MPFDELLANRVRSALEAESGVDERRMMGGLAFLKDGSMLGGVAGESLFVRVAPDRRDEVLAQPHVDPMTIGARATKSFVTVAPAAVESDAALDGWLAEGLAAAAESPGS